eukprot:869286-Pyramimonas_sp.AAC.1
MNITEKIAHLKLRPAKCVIVPVSSCFTPELKKKVQQLLDMFIPAWSEFIIEDKLFYLGMRVGPGASEDDSWELPISRYCFRCAAVGRGPTPASSSA